MIQIRNRFTGDDIAYGDNLASVLLKTKDLHYADLRGLNLYGEDLRNVNLGQADLGHADLSYAMLDYSNLTGANLRGANLKGATLYGTNLFNADLCDADLSYAYLRMANLGNSTLIDAKLCNADLCFANLGNANLHGADILGVKYDATTSFFAMQCPEEGSFVAWKKIEFYIVKLLIPEDAKRSSATTRKCRASHAEVLDIQNIDGSECELKTISNRAFRKTTYTIGEVTYADRWDDDRWRECSHGIHFFMTREEAVNY